MIAVAEPSKRPKHRKPPRNGPRPRNRRIGLYQLGRRGLCKLCGGITMQTSTPELMTSRVQYRKCIDCGATLKLPLS